MWSLFFNVVEEMEHRVIYQYIYMMITAVMVLIAYVNKIELAGSYVAMQVTVLLAFYFMRLKEGGGNVGVVIYSIISYTLIYPIYWLTGSQIASYILALIMPALSVIIWMRMNQDKWVGGVDPSVFEDYPEEYEDYLKEQEKKSKEEK